MNISFIINSILLGIGLAMDAFSVSLANGLNDTKMKTGKKVTIAGTFAFFQCVMPLIGWFLVTRIAEKFEAFQKFIPWIALFLLLIIGIDMMSEGLKGSKEKNGDDKVSDAAKLGFVTLILQGIATSIDALSVGFTIADYGFIMALICALIIAVVTFLICFAGLKIGMHFGTKLSGKAAILGGSILIFIGLEIFIKGVFL
ncbi:MAG: manganese efflux pump [Lachnospiraceae bacterium]|nr:manganese efflux pump [Lachnospiraceae bacterium]